MENTGFRLPWRCSTYSRLALFGWLGTSISWTANFMLTLRGYFLFTLMLITYFYYHITIDCKKLYTGEISKWFQREKITQYSPPRKVHRTLLLYIIICYIPIPLILLPLPHHYLDQTVLQTVWGVYLLYFLIAIVGIIAFGYSTYKIPDNTSEQKNNEMNHQTNKS